MTVDYLNLLLGNTKQSEKYWKTELKLSVRDTFFYLWKDSEIPDFVLLDLKLSVNLADIFDKLPKLIGLVLTDDLLQRYKTAEKKIFFDSREVLVLSDVLQMVPVVKDDTQLTRLADVMTQCLRHPGHSWLHDMEKVAIQTGVTSSLV